MQDNQSAMMRIILTLSPASWQTLKLFLIINQPWNEKTWIVIVVFLKKFFVENKCEIFYLRRWNQKVKRRRWEHFHEGTLDIIEWNLFWIKFFYDKTTRFHLYSSLALQISQHFHVYWRKRDKERVHWILISSFSISYASREIFYQQNHKKFD